ncbi:uncharacterized protein LOC117050449 [Lacerta agilis]|uniref:uncharacterized protein LOC117050449 n=1 Tax=Lacerta agilis TaxID=80427 RepID=UPI001419984C|nr:uncharacterized protein LOC117050449 [Lacerta agilis]
MEPKMAAVHLREKMRWIPESDVLVFALEVLEGSGLEPLPDSLRPTALLPPFICPFSPPHARFNLQAAGLSGKLVLGALFAAASSGRVSPVSLTRLVLRWLSPAAGGRMFLAVAAAVQKPVGGLPPTHTRTHALPLPFPLGPCERGGACVAPLACAFLRARSLDVCLPPSPIHVAFSGRERYIRKGGRKKPRQRLERALLLLPPPPRERERGEETRAEQARGSPSLPRIGEVPPSWLGGGGYFGRTKEEQEEKAACKGDESCREAAAAAPAASPDANRSTFNTDVLVQRDETKSAPSGCCKVYGDPRFCARITSAEEPHIHRRIERNWRAALAKTRGRSGDLPWQEKIHQQCAQCSEKQPSERGWQGGKKGVSAS